MKEKTISPISGWMPFLLTLALFFTGIYLFVIGIVAANLDESIESYIPYVLSGIGCVAIAVVCSFGCMVIRPNRSRVLLLFGEYKGSVKKPGFYFVNPFFNKLRLSLRIRNFQHEKPSKVNDSDGNPIEIAAVVVWRVVDTFQVLFEVENFVDFVSVQSDAALRNLASRYPYDCNSNDELSLRRSTDEINEQLRNDIQERLTNAGIEVLEARISHLAYAPEIASAMLKRQQAQAIIAARSLIVEGAVGIVQKAINELNQSNVVELDEERKAAMVSNLLVVLCSESQTQPVVNTGSIY